MVAHAACCCRKSRQTMRGIARRFLNRPASKRDFHATRGRTAPVFTSSRRTSSRNPRVDNLCHTLVGAALGEAGLKRRTAFGDATLMIASNLPDMDVLVFATGTPSVAFR